MSKKGKKPKNTGSGKHTGPSSGRSGSFNLFGPNQKKTDLPLATKIDGPSVTYLIRLTPVGNFFFGDESVNAEDGSIFYFQRSRNYPQQTTLLGMLRYQLLLQNGLLVDKNGRETIKNKDEAKILIGEKSFNESEDQTFGAILSLSPVFVLNDQKQYFPVPFVLKEVVKKDNIPRKLIPILPQLQSLTDSQLAFWDTKQQNRIDELVDYKSKNGLETRYVYADEHIGQEAVYADVGEQIGITKPQSWRNASDTATEGFFKMRYQRLQPGFSFGFYATLSPSARLTDSWVFMGKERSVFKMDVIPRQTSTLLATPTLSLGTKAIWLLSDACVDPAIYTYCQVAIAETVNFRNIHTTIHQANHFSRPARPEHEYRRELLQRGSLLFPKSDDSGQIESCLNETKTFHKIGYNHYTILQ